MNLNRRTFLTRRFGPRLKLFISYRRRFDASSARLLKKELTEAFGEGTVFRDVDDIAPGDAFPESIRRAVESCDVFLPLISPGWVEVLAELHEPDDFVRREIAAALARPVALLPVLLGGARMPDPHELPKEIREMASRQACELSDGHWSYDVARLVETVHDLTAKRGARVTFPRRVAAALRSFFGTRRGRVAAVAAVLLLAVVALLAALYSGRWDTLPPPPPPPDYKECLVLLSLPIANRATVELGAYDSPLLRPSEYAAARADDPAGVPLVLRLTDSGRDLGALSLRYFKEGQVFKVEWVLEPPCADVRQYLNHDRPNGDRHVLQNWDTLRARLGGRDYYLRLGDTGDRLAATLTQTPRN